MSENLKSILKGAGIAAVGAILAVLTQAVPALQVASPLGAAAVAIAGAVLSVATNAFRKYALDNGPTPAPGPTPVDPAPSPVPVVPADVAGLVEYIGKLLLDAAAKKLGEKDVAGAQHFVDIAHALTPEAK